MLTMFKRCLELILEELERGKSLDEIDIAAINRKVYGYRSGGGYRVKRRVKKLLDEGKTIEEIREIYNLDSKTNRNRTRGKIDWTAVFTSFVLFFTSFMIFTSNLGLDMRISDIIAFITSEPFLSIPAILCLTFGIFNLSKSRRYANSKAETLKMEDNLSFKRENFIKRWLRRRRYKDIPREYREALGIE